MMDFSAVRRWWPLAGVAGLLVAASLAAAHSSLRITRVDRPFDDQPFGPSGGPDSPQDSLPPSFPELPPTEIAAVESQFELPGWVGTAAATVGVVAVAVVVGLLLWALIRDVLRRRTRGQTDDLRDARSARTAGEVAAALDAGLADLSAADADPRRAVIACWVRLEQSAADAGTPRQPGDTPTDLVTRLLRAHQVSADVLEAFAHVYRQARYATGTVDEQMRVQARAALQRLRTELSTEVTS